MTGIAVSFGDGDPFGYVAYHQLLLSAVPSTADGFSEDDFGNIGRNVAGNLQSFRSGQILGLVPRIGSRGICFLTFNILRPFPHQIFNGRMNDGLLLRTASITL